MATIKTEKSSKPTRDPIADTTASRTPAELLAWIRANACTGDELAALAGQHVEVDRVLASHPQASAALLSSLSHSSDRATRSRVAANPDTPAADILRLGQQFPKEILANPALDLLLLENPALMEHVPESLLVRLLKQAGCPASLLTWAAARPEVKVQLAVAMNSSAPAAALERLRQSSHEAVVEATRARGGAIAPDADPEKVFEQAVRERLSSLTYDELQDAWSSGDIGLAQWTALSLNQRLIIATYSDFSGISPAAIARLLRDTSWTLTTLKELLPDCACWGEVAEKPATPLVVLEALSTSKLASERAGVAANPSTPVSILECLSRDPKSVVRRAVAKNPSIPLSVISGLSNDSDSGVRASVAGNESCPSDLLAKLAMDSDSDVRAELAANTVCPEEILDVLSRDSSRMVVRNVARNPSTPVKILEGFFRENKDPDLYPWLASNPSVPVSV
ncbi:MAG: hypothetical protein RI988_1670, partial [Pseudomonadota bacterium]